jgi:hypothetical protein
MCPSTRIRRLVGRLAADDRGIALPTALFATVASMALAGAAVMSSVDVQQGTHRDNGSKSAIGAADAGANVALLRLSRESEELASTKCFGGAPPSGGWCPPVSGDVGDANYKYEVSEPGLAACGEFELCVVATGTNADVSRRVMVNFCAGECDGIIEGGGPGDGGSTGEDGATGKKRGPEGIIGVEDIEIDNNGDARVNIGTNGNVHIHNKGNVCGNVRHGVGKKAEMDDKAEQCDGYEVFEGNVDVPAVSTFMPSNISTVNSDYRLAICTFDKKGVNLGPAGCQSDTYTKKWSSTVPWNPAATSRMISTANNETLTLGGGDYWLCRLELSNNSHLIMAAGAKVRLFFDTPEHCGIKSGQNQIYVSNGATITATGYLGTPGHFDMPGMYVMGSPTIPTNVEFKNNGGTNEFVLYAPQSHVELKQNSEYIGLIAGKSVHISENAIVDQPDGFVLDPELTPWHTEEETPPEDEPEPEPEPTPLVFTAQYYVECTGPASPQPNSGC